MSYKILVFDWLPPYLHEELPEFASVEELEDLADSLALELSDLNHQIRVERSRAKLENRLEDKEYLDWVERIRTRLRVKNGLNGIVLYNLRKIRQLEQNEQTYKIQRLEKALKACQEKNAELEATIKKINIKIEQNQTNTAAKFKKINEKIHRPYFKNFVFRAIYYLNSKVGSINDSESQEINTALSFLPKIISEKPDWGKDID